MRVRASLIGVWLCVTSSASTAAAQDRLFLSVPGRPNPIEVGAIGNFGLPIGPAPVDVFSTPLPRVEHFRAAANFSSIVDTQTLATVYQAPQGAAISAWTTTEDATRLFVATFGPGFDRRLQAIDVATGAIVAELTPDAGLGALTWVPGDRIVGWELSANHVIYDRDLRFLGRISLENSCQPQWMVSPHSGRAYVLSTGGFSQNFLFTSLLGFDAVAGTSVGRVNVSERFGVGRGPCYSFGATLWTAPGRPQRFAAAVAGREVAVSWLATDLAEGYVLDVGFAPGRTDATIYVGNTTRVIFANPPSGIFHLRVRAGNRMGGGRPSNEVRVVVP